MEEREPRRVRRTLGKCIEESSWDEEMIRRERWIDRWIVWPLLACAAIYFAIGVVASVWGQS